MCLFKNRTVIRTAAIRSSISTTATAIGTANFFVFLFGSVESVVDEGDVAFGSVESVVDGGNVAFPNLHIKKILRRLTELGP